MRLSLLATFLLGSAALFAQDKRPQQLNQTAPQQPNTELRTVEAAPNLTELLGLPPITAQGTPRTSTFDFSTIGQLQLPQSVAVQRAVTGGLSSVDPYAVNQMLDATTGRRFTTLSPAAAAQAIVEELNLPLINTSKELVFKSEKIDNQDVRHLRMSQQVDGVPVLGGEVIIHQGANGFTSVSGRLQPSLKSFTTEPALTVTQAEDEVYALVGQRASYELGTPMAIASASDSDARLVVWFDEGRTPHLAYVMTVHPDLAHRYEVIVDANDGQELRRLDQICKAFDGVHKHDHDGFSESEKNHKTPLTVDASLSSGPRTATALDLNGVTRTLQVFEESDFFLVDASRPMFNASSQVPGNMNGVIVTANGQGTYPDNSFNAVYSTTNNNSWADRREVSAHYNTEQSYEYFRQTFGRNSIDAQGGTVISFVNVTDENGSQMDNAFWNGRAMFYGNGNTGFSELSGSLDVGGHEMSHGVVQESANLEYQGESGALNESFADIFAVMIDRDDWLIGEDIVQTSQFPSGALRSMSDPRQGGNSLSDPGYQPATYATRYTGTQDNGGVHINSGIPNNAFYRIATSIGKEKAEGLFYDVLSNYLTRNAQFIDLRNGLQQRATAVYGAGSTEFNAVVAGLDAVGIPGSSGGGGGSTGPTNQGVNPGDELVVFANAAEQLVRLANANGQTVIADITPSVAPASRVTVSDDGSLAMLASADGRLNVISINYSTNTVSENLLTIDLDSDGDSDVRSVALSRSGTHFAMVTTAQDANLFVFELSSGEGVRFPLYTPGSNGEPVYTVDYADALEWDYEGRSVVFDALNTLTGAGGLEYTNWDIGVIDVLNAGGGQNWADGRIQKLFGALEDGTSLGNPTLAKNSEDIMAFDYYDGSDWNLVAINLTSGTSNALFQSTELTWPTYNAADDRLLFNATNNGEEIIAGVTLTADKLNNSDPGNAFVFANDAYRGSAFANGSRLIVSALPELLAGAAWTIAPNPASDLIEILRTADADVSDVAFELYDLNGRLLQTYAPNTLRIDLTNRATGTYTLKQGEASKIFVVR
ncbi:MAG: M4 family metallopeptidase [Saprospiraceae bacterium]